MKIANYIIIAVAIGLIVLNVTKLDFENLFQGESVVALICIIAILCAVCLLLIYSTSKSIEGKTK